MISIVCACIPPFLRDGTFYCSLNSEEQDSEIQMPAQCYAENDAIKDIDDFAQLLRVTAFWGLHRIPLSIIEFCDTHYLSEWDSLLKSEFAVATATLGVYTSATTLCEEVTCTVCSFCVQTGVIYQVPCILRQLQPVTSAV